MVSSTLIVRGKSIDILPFLIVNDDDEDEQIIIIILIMMMRMVTTRLMARQIVQSHGSVQLPLMTSTRYKVESRLQSPTDCDAWFWSCRSRESDHLLRLLLLQ